MEERRKHKRKDLLFYSRVYDARGGTMIGNLLNITPQGAMVLADKPIEPGIEFNLHIELPEGISDKTFIDVDARSLWHQPDINPEFIDIGFEFTRIDEQDLPIISRLVDEYGFRD
ncbi:MAG: PilZ domain-containing protein [Anaerolineales bacterium]|nr:PilZ domain-containing protein [Anaerolineales bacterium]